MSFLNLYNNIQIARALQKIQISNLYPWQSEVLPSILSGKDTFILQATSGGKSLLYQLPAIMEEGQMLTIVVSPLRALQEDQVDALHTKGICAVLLNSDLSSTARRTILKTLPQTSLLYLAPEQLSARPIEKLVRSSASYLPDAKFLRVLQQPRLRNAGKSFVPWEWSHHSVLSIHSGVTISACRLNEWRTHQTEKVPNSKIRCFTLSSGYWHSGTARVLL